MPAFALLGSGEFEPWAAEVDRWVLRRARPGPVIVSPAASAPEGDEVFDRWGSRGVEHYAGLGVDAAVLPVRDARDAAVDEARTAPAIASMLFFSGGNPAHLADTLRHSPLWRAIAAEVDRGLVLAGCSAGAAALGTRCLDTRLVPGPGARLDDAWAPGLALLDAMIAPHWDTTERVFPGGQNAIRSASAGRLVGLGERTALVGDGRRWSVIGAGSVYVLDGESERSVASGTEIELELR